MKQLKDVWLVTGISVEFWLWIVKSQDNPVINKNFQKFMFWFFTLCLTKFCQDSDHLFTLGFAQDRWVFFKIKTIIPHNLIWRPFIMTYHRKIFIKRILNMNFHTFPSVSIRYNKRINFNTNILRLKERAGKV